MVNQQDQQIDIWRPFIDHGNIATSGGCLAAQYVIGWVIEKKADKAWKELVLKSIQPVGEGLKFSDAPELLKLYGPAANEWDTEAESLSRV